MPCIRGVISPIWGVTVFANVVNQTLVDSSEILVDKNLVNVVNHKSGKLSEERGFEKKPLLSTKML